MYHTEVHAMAASKTFQKFVESINDHDVDRLCDLMTENHKFIDSLGNVFSGRQNMRLGWIHYFDMFPDYQISCYAAFQQGNVVVAVGSATGTYAPDGKFL